MDILRVFPLLILASNAEVLASYDLSTLISSPSPDTMISSDSWC